MSRARVTPRLRVDARGASFVEHVLVVALVALVALGAWSLLGQNVGDQVQCAARAIGGSGSDCGDGAGTSGVVAVRGPSIGRGAWSLTAEQSYEARLGRALDALSDARTFGALSGQDDRITRSDLEAALESPSSDRDGARAAAELLLTSPAALNALDVAHGGDVDGEVSLEDVRDLRRELARGDARAPNAETGCGWYRIDCHVAPERDRDSDLERRAAPARPRRAPARSGRAAALTHDLRRR